MIRIDLPEKFETTRLLLQRLRYEDAEEIFYSYASKSEATRFVSWRTHQSIEDTRDFLQVAYRAWRLGTDYTFSIRIKETGLLIGSIGAVNEHGKIQFGYVISPTQWNKGYATEACQSLLELFKCQQDVYRIWTLVDEDNTASIRVLQKCGLQEEAKLPRWMRFVNQNSEPKDCILFRLIP